ncbi:hypothetical protein [Azospirillum picis]|uniref:Restriction endonuclease type IV Mrr domain-containing protein n=1 Tax=Azospirillum picis TaxID=488438 RepID=A0ABU0MTK9_9PROT|nr:hypothetical protein [Azospirillum picis]MBP2302999.1 hypothetical protein [Azospirillum picis]MDQ0536751.1 hypothetical protein [Azospirillum picis]
MRRLVRLFPSVCLIALTVFLSGPVDAFSPKTAFRVAEVMRQIARVDEAHVERAVLAYRRGGYLALTKSMEGITDKSAIGGIFLRVAVTEGKLADEEAAVLLKELHAVPGYEKAARALLISDVNFTGAIQELRAARALKESGGEVRFIRMEFKDVGKKGVTDIDIFANVNGRVVAVESKAYKTAMRWDEISRDADTLLHVKEINPSAVGCFLFLEKPSELALKMIEERGLKAVWGDPGMIRYCV